MTSSRPGSTPACSGRLVHLGPRERQVVELGDQAMTFGRGPAGVEVALPGVRVSRRHFRLEPVTGGRHLLVDLGSANGTWVNERRVASAVLEPLDRISAGEHVFVYLDPAIPAAKVLELLSPAETGAQPRPSAKQSRLTERLLGLALLVQEQGSVDLISTLDTVLGELLEATGAATGIFLLEDEGDRPLRPLHAQGVELDPDTLEALRPALQAALGEGRPARQATVLGPTLCVPLEGRRAERRRAHAGEVRGALFLAGGEGVELGAAEEELLGGLARQIALVIGNARLERQVTTDALTELPNRAYLERLLAQALLEARDGGPPVAVILLDVDDFKRVNDTHGHAVGDDVLRHIAGRLRWALRHSDSAGRWGGEEFLVVLPGTDLAGASLVADKVVQLIESSPGPAGIRVTVSAGVAAAPAHGLEQGLLVERADQALYAAKRAGKNRGIAWSPELQAALEAHGAKTQRLPGRPLGAAALDQLVFERPVAWLASDLLPAIPLHPGTTLIGRSPTCEVVLPHKDVSRQHGVLVVSDEGAHISFEDCSRNGTRVNGERVVDEVELREGDVLQVGPYELVLRRQASGDALDVTPATQMLGGSLEESHLCGLLLNLESTRATGVISFRSGELAGDLVLRDGNPVSARAGTLRDLEAVRRLMGLERGIWTFLPGPPTREPARIPLTTSGLLLEACPRASGRERCAGIGGRCPLETSKAQRQHFAG